MADKAVVIIVGGGGGAPTIPQKPQGTPGLQDCAGECTGSMYGYLGKSFTPDALREGHNPGRSKSQQKLAAAMREVMTNEPSTVARADVSPERKMAMRKAIAFSKARAAGARLPRQKG